LLVGEQQALAGARGSQDRAKAGGTYDGRDQDGALAVRRYLLERFGPEQQLRPAARLGEAPPQCQVLGRSGEHRVTGSMAPADFEQGVGRAVRGHGEYAVAVRMARDDVEGACPDRAGRAEQCQSLCHVVPIACTRRSPTGSAAVALSIRSSTPPWPGSSLPLSFVPACRLRPDSSRSPTTPSAQRSNVPARYGNQISPCTRERRSASKDAQMIA